MPECAPQFDTTINFDCLRKIIANIRSGGSKFETLQLIFWVGGSVINVTNPSPTFGDSGPAEPATLEEAVSNLETFCDAAHVVTDSGNPATMNPTLLATLLQLLLKLLTQ